MPCASPLTHGGRPPANTNWYSHAFPPARLTAYDSISRAIAPTSVSYPLARKSWFIRPNVPSHWICTPWPG